jgi:hypothetical protein
VEGQGCPCVRHAILIKHARADCQTHTHIVEQEHYISCLKDVVDIKKTYYVHSGSFHAQVPLEK